VPSIFLLRDSDLNCDRNTNWGFRALTNCPANAIGDPPSSLLICFLEDGTLAR